MKKIITLIALLMTLSCKNEQIKVITVYTELPEVIPFIEAFNKSGLKTKLIVERSDSGKKSDLIIYKGQQNSTSLNTMDVSYLLENEIDLNNFYPDIIESVIEEDGSCRTLPLTFDIRGLIYNKNRHENIRTTEVEKIVEEESVFSPYWDDDFIIWYYLTTIPEFSLDQQYFDLDEFRYTAEKIIKMYSDDDFDEKYLHLSPERLVDDELIDFYFTSISQYIEMDRNEYRNIRFSILEHNNLIQIDDEMIYIAVNSTSTNRMNVDEVLKWFFNKDNQDNFLKRKHKDLLNNPLFLGGLSTLKDVTRRTLPSLDSTLQRIIPVTENITTPPNLPDKWDSLKAEVFRPIFIDIKTSPYSEWQNRYSEYYSNWNKRHNK